MPIGWIWRVSGLTLKLEWPFPGLRRLGRCRFRRDDQEFPWGMLCFEMHTRGPCGVGECADEAKDQGAQYFINQ